ncbi:protein FAM92A-like [Anneissia japonica]|uniref:protein FAM92A-like n=1 Tax=Anneissia japonica TaxID=1529436 RepID=UPI001425A89F|nr:protein FAM92A-like [Anneissia japonica]XP_033104215.1 protein FAM92A-like [Anneissia japonica]XP_033104216.1 protein FAM92A-like [Anneissia japonica]
MTQRGSDIRARENQSKFAQQRIVNVEKHFSALCQNMSTYARKVAKLRDAGDDISKTLLQYAESEMQTTKAGMTGLAEQLSAVQDYRHAQVERLEYKVVQPLSLYGTACKHAKDDLKSSFSARDKELNEQKKLEKVRQKKPGDRQQISQAESKLQKASVDASRSNRALEEQMDTFEKKKMEDIKTILREFLTVEMLFHSKCLEVYTNAWQCINSISDDDDLEEFRNSLRPLGSNGGGSQTRLNLSHQGSKASLNSTGQSKNSTMDKKQTSKNQKDKTTVQDWDDDDDDDDEDDYDDDEEDDDDEY